MRRRGGWSKAEGCVGRVGRDAVVVGQGLGDGGWSVFGGSWWGFLCLLFWISDLNGI